MHSLSLILLSTFLISSPLWASNYEQKALAFEQKSLWVEARRSWQHEITQHPNNLEARFHLAQILEQGQHLKSAQKLYESNIQRGKHLASEVHLYQLYLQQKKPQKALNLLLKATKKFSHEAVPWYLLAEYYHRLQQDIPAHKYFKKAVMADPLNAFAHLHLARFLAHKQQFSSAVRHAKKSVRLAKMCAPCWHIYGDILQQNQQFHAALQAYQSSLVIKPNQETRQKLILLLQRLGHRQRAKRMQQALNAEQKYAKSLSVDGP
ncbi:MAG: hypothetical protein R8K49_05505 [Mariprofundaceae bacterium]